MKGCISFSLYGDASKYSFGAVENAKLAKKHYPGWVARFYVDRGHYAIPALEREGAQVIQMDPQPGSRGMFWRFLAADDPSFTHVIIRDADSRISPREVVCVDEWLASGKKLHRIRDHWWHEQREILGGAWGIEVGVFPMKSSIGEWDHTNDYGCDENFLAAKVWAALMSDSVTHTYNPVTSTDFPIPEHEPCIGHVCEQINPTLPFNYRAVVLSPEHYSDRRERFFASHHRNGHPIHNIEWVRGRLLGDTVVPSFFDHSDRHPHYYLATRDHIDILERAIVSGVDYLFVFEDDATFCEDFGEYLFRALLTLPEDWHALMLGGQTDDGRSLVSEGTEKTLARVKGTLGMHGILWSRAGMERAYEHFRYWHKMTVDQAFAGLQGDEGNVYAPAKWIVEIDQYATQFGQDQ